jgi:Holliday junction resolvasome RuvABC endonuclease subunit
VTVLGIDASLTSTGYAWFGLDDTWTVGTIQPGKLVGTPRLWDIENRLKAQVDERRPALAVLEGYSYGAARFSSAVFDLGELGGVIRLMLAKAGVPTAIIAPDTLKLYATGDGAASKTAMQVAALKRAGQEFDRRKQGEDECDAWWLACAGLEYLGTPVVKVPKAQTAALRKVSWPIVATAAVGSR